MKERGPPQPIAGEQVAQICQGHRAIRHRQAKQRTERRRTERVAGDEQQAEERLQLRAPPRPRAAQAVQLEREEVPRLVEQQRDQLIRRQHIGAGQLAGDEIEIERIALQRRVEAVNQRRVEVAHLTVAQHEVEVSATEGRQPIGGRRCPQFQRVQRIVRARAEDKDDPWRRHQRQKTEVTHAVSIRRELVEAINDNQLTAPQRGKGAQRLGEIRMQRGAVGGGNVDRWQAVFENKLGE